MIDKKREREIWARLNATTPGLWTLVLYADDYDQDNGVWNEDRQIAYCENENDSRFIANAPQDIRYLLDERDVLIQRLATMENLASGILAATIDEGAGEKVSEAITNLALYGATLE